MVMYVIHIYPGIYAHLEPKSCAKMIEQVPTWGCNYITGKRNTYQVSPGVGNPSHQNGKRIQNLEARHNNKGASKRHKTDKKSTHFAVHVPPSIFGLKKIPPHPEPIQKCSGILGKKCWQRNTHAVLYFVFVLFQSKNIYIFLELSILLHLGTHLSNTGKELVYYHLYHLEASFLTGL